uniref:Uncharacterized protein n=1 Tax=Sinocyclocheilus grahami TaxID=75366 RepID=A0A672SEI8_SINGR
MCCYFFQISITYRPITKSVSDNGIYESPIHTYTDNNTSQWGPPDRKVDTRKYRAEPRSIFDYEPGKSSILEQERAVGIQ